jgi:hypothetical protein
MKLRLATFAISIFALTSCNHAALERDVSQQVANESNIKTGADLNASTNSTLENSKDITPEQRDKLMALKKITKEKLDTNSAETNKLKSVLIKNLVQTNYKENEVELIKSKLKTLNSKRLSIMFDSVESANSILGRQARLNDNVMRDFVRIEHD